MDDVSVLSLVGVNETVRVKCVNVGGALGLRLRDLGFVKGMRVQPAFSGGGIRAYAVCGTVIAIRDSVASRIEVEYE